MKYKLVITNKKTGEETIKNLCCYIKGVNNSKTEVAYCVELDPGYGFGIIDLTKYKITLDKY